VERGATEVCIQLKRSPPAKSFVIELLMPRHWLEGVLRLNHFDITMFRGKVRVKWRKRPFLAFFSIRVAPITVNIGTKPEAEGVRSHFLGLGWKTTGSHQRIARFRSS
jgi:hypothetical protein